MRLPVCLTLFACAVSLDASADSMRCGKWVVGETASVAELLEKCGAPLDKTITTEDVLAINAAGVPYKTGTTTREQWFYQRSPQTLPMVVTIVDGAIKSIERAK
jgi:hypothetical protein